MDRNRSTCNGDLRKPLLSGCLAVPAAALSVAFEPIQSGTGDPSPTNIRPISGRTEVGIISSGKNRCGEIENGAINPSDGQNVPNATTYRTKDYIPVEYGTTYNINNLLAYSQAIRVFFYDANKGYISNDTYMGTNASTGISVTVNVANVKFVRFHANQVIMTNTTPVQMEVGSVPTAYTPYQAPSSLTIALGQTVYGGNLDVKTGVLTVTDELVIYDGSDDENWSEVEAGNNNKNMLCPAISGLDIAATISDGYCNQYKVLTGAQTWGNTVGLGIDSNGMIRVYDLGYNTEGSLSAWKTHLAATPLQLCYELATPATVQLTPAQLTMLKGYNSLSTDGGDVITVTAYAINEEVGS